MKKYLFLFSIFALIFTSCQKKSAEMERARAGKITVLATVFPVYDWAKNLAAGSESVSVDLLLKDGVDLHSFQPSAADIVKISTADIFIYVGGESDTWVATALKNAGNENQIVINLMEVLKGFIKEEEVVEGMQTEEDEHDHSGEESHDSEDEHSHSLEIAQHTHDGVEYDEHVWLSLNNAIASSNEIARALMEKDEAHAQIYMANLVSYVDRLAALKQEKQSSFATDSLSAISRTNSDSNITRLLSAVRRKARRVLRRLRSSRSNFTI